MKIVYCPECGENMRDESIGWRCPKCKGFVSFIDGKFYPHIERPFVPPMTNADRIRAMSDEELATMLFDYKECSKNCIMNSGKHCYEICEEESCILKWLQQPTEVTNGH